MSEPDCEPLKVGDLVPTWVLDDDGTIVAALLATVVRVTGAGDYEIEYPDGRRETIREPE
jgi:hypothetical protein